MGSKLRIAGIIPESIVDGPGIRFVIFSQGCPHHCKGCHNPSTFDFNGGSLVEIDEIFTKIKQNPLLKGVTFSGGEPFLQAEPFSKLAVKCHEIGLNVISYTGYTFETILSNINKNSSWKLLLNNIDILIDGPFVESQKSLTLMFRGSANQRILDVKSSLQQKKAILISL